MKTIALVLTLLFASVLHAQQQQAGIIPQPANMEVGRGNFHMSKTTYLVTLGSGMDNTVNFLNNYLQTYYGFSLQKETKADLKNAIVLNFERMDNELPGAYSMEVGKDQITINGDNEEGIFYGIQSLIQLLPVEKLPTLRVPIVSIRDAPRFAYRGMHFDVSRHFFPVSFVKKYIDYLAYHKMNYFHWHLTDDQGWRIEIKKYPNLTKTGARRNGTIIGRYPGTGSDNKPYGGFYTQEEIKDVVAYAAKRYITVVPEIELPGHASAAIASYAFLSCFPDEPTKIPANMISKLSVQQQKQGRKKLVQETWGVFDDVFCAGKDSTFKFLQDVLDEVMPLFPSKYIHIGGDECPKSNWKRCPNCQKRMKDEKLKDEHELQSYFIQRMEKHVNAKGKTIIGWDEILEGGLAPNAVVMSWRGEEGGIAAARQNHDVIMTPGGWLYIDHSQSQNEDSVTIGGYTPIEKTYSYNPVPDSLTEEQGKHILGAQGNLWTEYIKNTRKVEYMIFPRLSAVSEVQWTARDKKNWTAFETRLAKTFKRYDLWKANYSKAYYDLKSVVTPSENHDGVIWKLESRVYDPRIRWMEKKPGNNLTLYVAPVKITKTSEYIAVFENEKKQKVNEISQKFFFNKATGKTITLTSEPSRNYPGEGAFTLVNGVQNQKGLARSREILGFSGTDCEAVIDLDSVQTISKTKVHIFQQVPSWIWKPQSVEVFVSDDGIAFRPVIKSTEVSTKNGNGVVESVFPPISARYVKFLIKNWGVIPEGNAGAGNKAWLFVDEIEVE